MSCKSANNTVQSKVPIHGEFPAAASVNVYHILLIFALHLEDNALLNAGVWRLNLGRGGAESAPPTYLRYF